MLWLYGKVYCVAWRWLALPLFQLGLLGGRPILHLAGFGELRQSNFLFHRHLQQKLCLYFFRY